MRTWHLETRKIKDLLSNPKNPRYIKKDMASHLEKNISKHGLIDKPVITHDGQIIGGHQRINILKKMKQKDVECWVPDDPNPLSQDEIDEICIGMNLHQGEFDFDILANMWDVDKLFGYGFTPQELLDVNVEDILKEQEEEKKTEDKKCKMCPHCGKEI